MTTKKIWLESYPPGIPAEIDAHAYSSLNDLLRQGCARFAGQHAFVNMGVAIGFRGLDRRLRDFAAGTAQQAGPGGRMSTR